MKVFSNCTVVLQFDSLTSFKSKVSWRNKITDNGGVVSYVLTKKASFLVVFNAKSASCSFKIRQSYRHNIPVVGPRYVDQCLARKRLLDVNPFKLTDENNNERFNKGKIAGEKSMLIKQRKKKRFCVNLKSHPSWRFQDFNAPKFNESSFELPKWALLIDKDQKSLQVLEVHVCTEINADNKFRLYVQKGFLYNEKVTLVEDGIVWYFDNVTAAVSGYEQLYRQFSSPPVSMVNCEPGSVDIGNLGSNIFRMVMGKLSILNEKISPQVAALTDIVWKSALEEVDSLLEVPMQFIKDKQIEDGRTVLAKVAEKLTTGDTDVKSLYEEFYEIIPYKTEHRTDCSLKDVVIKQDLCQLLSDIVSVSEATDWSTEATVIAKYQALGCHISWLNQSGDEFKDLKETLETSLGSGGTVHNIYRVRRTFEEVNFLSDIGPIQALMHTSQFSNYLGILSRGLILPNVVTDKMGVSRTDAGFLGSGIYFADSARKSAQYSHPSRHTGTRLMLLCDVALGQKYGVREPNPALTAPPEGFDSVHGVKVTEETKSHFQDDEYAIYNPNQKCVKYLIEFSLPHDDVKLQTDIDVIDIDVDIPTIGKTVAQEPSIDLQDVVNVPDPLAKVKAGLQGNKNEHIPLKSVHVRAKLMDMISQVVVLQAYRNDNKNAIEAKYVFPIDAMAAVCGFEAFINGKHIIGEVKEKAKARKEYREAISKGHGAYLMEEETPEVFSVSVGNLPPLADVLIKITYITELQVDGDAICFNLPAAVAPWLRDGSLAQKTQSTTESVKVLNNKRCETSLQVSMEMPSDIKKISSPTHKIKCKKTATKAVVALPKQSFLENGFQLNIYLAEIHAPRMWVERHPTFNTHACMLTFYPEFDANNDIDPEIIILLDMSNSMKADSEKHAKKVALLMLDSLPAACLFNVILFGSTFMELFPSAQRYSKVSAELAKKYIEECSATMGSTDIWSPLHAMRTLSQSNTYTSNIFVISDGHVTQESEVVIATRKAVQKNRVFTLGVGSTLNQHLLRNLAAAGGGTYEYYNVDTKSSWQRKMTSQIEKACQPGLSDVSVDWLQTDETAPPPMQAPNQIPCLFSGCRQVVYGFVESSMKANLKAKVGGYDMSTMVSTTDLHITTGEILHRLTARAVIADNENGLLDENKIKHQVLKTTRKQFIVELSKKFSIVTPYTSFVAVEDRTEENISSGTIPSISDLVAKETVDNLPYMTFGIDQDEEEKEPEVCIEELLQKGEVAENFSMVQAEEMYTELDSYFPYIIGNPILLERVYHTLSRFYTQNQAPAIGAILSQLEPELKRMLQCRENPMANTGTNFTVVLSLNTPNLDLDHRVNIMTDIANLEIPEGDDAQGSSVRYCSALYSGILPEFGSVVHDPKTRSMFMGLEEEMEKDSICNASKALETRLCDYLAKDKITTDINVGQDGLKKRKKRKKKMNKFHKNEEVVNLLEDTENCFNYIENDAEVNFKDNAEKEVFTARKLDNFLGTNCKEIHGLTETASAEQLSSFPAQQKTLMPEICHLFTDSGLNNKPLTSVQNSTQPESSDFQYLPNSPFFSPTSPSYSPLSPTFLQNNNQEDLSQYMYSTKISFASQLFDANLSAPLEHSESSPAYSPTCPLYPTSDVVEGPACPMYSPISPAYPTLTTQEGKELQKTGYQQEKESHRSEIGQKKTHRPCFLTEGEVEILQPTRQAPVSYFLGETYMAMGKRPAGKKITTEGGVRKCTPGATSICGSQSTSKGKPIGGKEIPTYMDTCPIDDAQEESDEEEGGPVEKSSRKRFTSRDKSPKRNSRCRDLPWGIYGKEIREEIGEPVEESRERGSKYMDRSLRYSGIGVPTYMENSSSIETEEDEKDENDEEEEGPVEYSKRRKSSRYRDRSWRRRFRSRDRSWKNFGKEVPIYKEKFSSNEAEDVEEGRPVERLRRKMSRSRDRSSRRKSITRDRSWRRRSRSMDRSLRRSRSMDRLWRRNHRSRDRSLRRSSRSRDRSWRRSSRSRDRSWRKSYRSSDRSLRRMTRDRSSRRNSRSRDSSCRRSSRSRDRSWKRNSRSRDRSSRSSRSMDRSQRRSSRSRDRSWKRSSRSRDRSLRRSYRSRDRSLRRSYRSRDRSRRSSGSRERSQRKSSRSRDRSWKRSSRSRDRSLRRSYRSRDRSLRRSYRSRDRSRRSSGSRDRSQRRSSRSRDRSWKRSYRSKDRSLKRSYRSRDRSLRRSYRSRDRSWRRSIRSRDIWRRSSRSRDCSLRRSSRSRERSSKRIFRSRDRSENGMSISSDTSLQRRSREKKRQPRCKSIDESMTNGIQLSKDPLTERLEESQTMEEVQKPFANCVSNTTDSIWNDVVSDMTDEKNVCYDLITMRPEGQVFYDLTPQLCSKLELSYRGIVMVLQQQGIKSLGDKRVKLLHRVLASYLVVIFVVKILYKHKFGRRLDGITMATGTIVSNRFIHLFGFDILVLPVELSSMLSWLEEQEKTLPPLYETLELAKTKQQFFADICELWRNV